MKKLNLFYENSQTLEDEVIFDYVAEELPPAVNLLVEIHLACSPEDQARVEQYKKWREKCQEFRDRIIVDPQFSQASEEMHTPGMNVVYYKFRAEETEEKLAADDTLADESIKPNRGVIEEYSRAVTISTVLLKVTLSKLHDQSVWLKMEALEPAPAHRRFRIGIGIGTYRGEVFLDGDHPPFFETELPASLFSSFGNVLIQLQPSDEPLESSPRPQ